MNFCNETTREEFEGLKKENELLREHLAEFSGMMEEVVKVRKSVLERRLSEPEAGESKFLVGIRNELYSLTEADMHQSGLSGLKDNIKRFREVMDKIDSANFGLPLDKAYQFSPGADIDEIKNLKKLKDLVSTPL